MQTTESFCQEVLIPGVIEANHHEHFDRTIMLKMGELGLLGCALSGYECAGMSMLPTESLPELSRISIQAIVQR